ncbi:MAG: F0F1 ATP synthase subunit I [Gammaproteobacteria bacterium]|nr:F0F1 ATP synthase subunit I [Gammaproteobacteria bacterium]
MTVSNIKAPPVYIAFIVQFLLCIAVALIALLTLNLVTAYSILLGGFISIVPNGYFAWKAFRYRGARNTPLIVKSFYAGETGKLIMTVVLFALVFAGVRPIDEPAIIVSFIVNIIVGLLATAWVSVTWRKLRKS